MIEVRKLTKHFNGTPAVDGINFALKPGESFGLLGPNGAGKTTTLHLIAGLLKPSGGEVLVGGEADPRRPAVRRKLGVAPQVLALYEELTGAENLAFFGELYGLQGTKLRARVEWGLDFAELSDRAHDLVRVYSGGMQRRLSLACALIHEPPVLLLDEPTVGVDPHSRNHLLERIEGLKKEGHTILYTTHYMHVAARLCDRVAIMDHGKILALDSVEQLITAHGGDAVVSAELAAAPADSAALPGTLDGRHLHFRSGEPLREVARLAEAGVTFNTLKVDQPDLEAVFLALTGRSLRD